jgi:hypothetical protein
MADNFSIKDGNGTTRTMRATDSGGVHTTHTKIDSLPADPLGANADAAIVTDTTGSINGKLRGLVKWAFERMPAALGQALMAASFPVVIASNQSAVAVSDGGGSLTVDGTVTPAATENHIGEVGQKLVVVSATPVISTSAYATGDAVGAVMSFASATRVAAGSGVVESVTITDKAKQSANLDLLLFDTNPSVAPTDNAACVIADADLLTCVGVIPVTNHYTLDDNGLSCARAVGLGFKLAAGTTLYGVLVVRNAPTYATASDLQVRLAIRQN